MVNTPARSLAPRFAADWVEKQTVLSTWPDHVGLGVGCAITAVAMAYGAVAMALPGGISGLTTIASSIMVMVGGIAAGWLVAARYFFNEPVASGWRALHFPETYQFEDLFSWRYSTISALDALARTLEVLGQIGWLVLLPLDRLGRWFARQVRRWPR